MSTRPAQHCRPEAIVLLPLSTSSGEPQILEYSTSPFIALGLHQHIHFCIIARTHVLMCTGALGSSFTKQNLLLIQVPGPSPLLFERRFPEWRSPCLGKLFSLSQFPYRQVFSKSEQILLLSPADFSPNTNQDPYILSSS